MSLMRPVVRFASALFAIIALLQPAFAASSTVPLVTVTALILRERPAVKQAPLWAEDMLAAFSEIQIPASRENVCAGIAIISQESGFSANPAVPDLGRLSEQALRGKLDAIPIVGSRVLDFLENKPSPEDSIMDRIRAARTERDLDLVYRGIISDIGSVTELRMLIDSGLLNRFIEQRNEISTIGSMQVSVAFALATERQRRWTPMNLQDTYAVRDALYTRKGGITYGLLQLLGYDSGYDRKIFRFADYNAGRYASRNAAFQLAVAELSGVKLDRDGDLLAYGASGKPSRKAGKTEMALRKTIGARMSEADIRSDLTHEKKQPFIATRVFTEVRDLYQRKTGKPAAFAIVPEIALKSVKISSRMTTAIFAARVNERYQRCMKKP